jgi:hypothetical protein
MWDQVATLLFLNKDLDQRIINTKVSINDEGKIVDDVDGINTNIYIYVNSRKFDKAMCEVLYRYRCNYYFIIFVLIILLILYFRKNNNQI